MRNIVYPCIPLYIKLHPAGPSDIVSTQTLNEKTAAQLEAAVFLCYWYGATVSTPGGTSDSDGTNYCQAGGAFDTQTLLLSMLSEEVSDFLSVIGCMFQLLCYNYQGTPNPHNSYDKDGISCTPSSQLKRGTLG